MPPTAFFYYVSPDLYFIMNSGNNILIMCDAYTPAGNPIPTNKKHNAAKIFSNSKVASEEPWYGIEEEYTLMQKGGPYYCGVGADKAIGRDIMDAHYKACLYAGIGISGVNGEVMPGQWKFQVGPVEEKLQVKHKENIAAYGEGSERRLTGKHETAYINTFSWGVANRGASVRVGQDTEKEGKGYFEDKRPASNMDPYVVTSMI
ncbi:hypothetical protein IGI04_012211 [Brassica rapa subsp. trilocularis]|uniref:glutamine synthetase n=1 Tax=Brassica rapa subsp. trilocularis TaxID=1813537 RepID=A0ABQ7N596_BRACM|nr:hypothetical protein IGI04_012211 [Brassica rapa subsp. trilocularis]